MNERPWIAHYDKGVPATIDYPKEPLFYFLDESARKYPDRACTIFKGAVISFREMNDLTDHISAALVDMGVKKGDRVGIFMPNIPQFVMAYFGILKAGGVVVAVNPTYPVTEILKPVKDADIQIMFVMSRFYETVKKAKEGTHLKSLIVTNIKEALPPVTRLLFTLAREKKSGDRVDGLSSGDVWLKDLLAGYRSRTRPQVEVSAEDIALFQYSGGTTGDPKAATALHRNVVANTLQVKHWFVIMEDGQETLLMAIPLFHVYGMVAGMLYAISTGASMVMIPNARDIPDVLENINKYHPTTFPGVPTLYNAINNHPDVKEGKVNLRSVKACISGSAPLLRETKEKFEELSGGKVFEGYGLSEAPTATHCNPLMGIRRSLPP